MDRKRRSFRIQWLERLAFWFSGWALTPPLEWPVQLTNQLQKRGGTAWAAPIGDAGGGTARVVAGVAVAAAGIAVAAAAAPRIAGADMDARQGPVDF